MYGKTCSWTFADCKERMRGGHWVDQSMLGAVFADERLDKRLRSLLERLTQDPGVSIPLVSARPGYPDIIEYNVRFLCCRLTQ